MFSALLDTCVLWPSLQRDFLLSLAAEGTYRPLWSDEILIELEIHESRKLTSRGIPKDQADHRASMLIDRLIGAFDDSTITGWKPLEGSYGLPDPADEHVLAAAVIGQAGAIVTENLRDFPRQIVPASIDLLPAREFLADSVDISHSNAVVALQQMSDRYRNPRLTPLELLLLLRDRYRLSDVFDMLHPYVSE